MAVPADHRIRLKIREKKDRYLDLASEKKTKKNKNKNQTDKKTKANKLWNMKMMVIPIVIGALGTIPKGLVKGLEDLEIRG